MGLSSHTLLSVGAGSGLRQMRGAKYMWQCRDHSLGPSVTGCLTFGLKKIWLHHRQSKMVSVGQSTEETSLLTAITDPTEHLGADGHEEQSCISTGPDGCWDLWFHVWKPRFVQALGDSKPLGEHLDPHRGLEGKREWKAKGVIKIPFMGMVGGGYSQLLPETLRWPQGMR